MGENPIKALSFLCLTAFALALGLPSADAQTRNQCFEVLCIDTATRGETTILTARNTARNTPITVSLALRLDNLDAEGTGQAVLAPGKARQLFILTPRGRGASEFTYDYSWMPGDFRARPDPRATYALPFRGAALPVLQGCDGWFSHRGELGQSIDFAMPIGTQVHAARAGRVIFTKRDSQRGGPSQRFINDDNKVLVQHADGSVAAYAHLAFDSARVVPGQDVRAGDVLALSGNTGFSAEPHLHFELYTPKPEGGRQTWPVRWRIGDETVVCPRRGTVLNN
ncbi:M23 family metallopeptidase [Maribius pontilimi]|uniref:M23 family metallopeptidase n=1 Tax=Palleronia pontilimi TaxID=1964209 RepID=A0A934I977_9RHOB|nr:M23 family metallopeptidase [Palleronia pontilimi]MBJ3762804.1 M23 family metallopeptidase [Palleronia pontilimi]